MSQQRLLDRKAFIVSLLTVFVVLLTGTALHHREDEGHHRDRDDGRQPTPHRRRHLTSTQNVRQTTSTAAATTPDQTSSIPTNRRPVMHTFFRTSSADKMNQNWNETMLGVWQESWQNAGWDTKILTIDDALKHPEFDKMHAKIKKFNFDHYNMLCYYRWLAMATVPGGGWMSDYDTLPLNDFTSQGIDLPFGGFFTIYQGHVPSLMSGSQHEWVRMTKRLVEYGSKHKDKDGVTLSDMMTLLEFQSRYKDMMVSRHEVEGIAVPPNDQWTQQFCQQKFPQQIRAMHFSHVYIERFWKPTHPDATTIDRPLIATKWLKDWLHYCGRQTFHEWQYENEV